MADRTKKRLYEKYRQRNTKRNRLENKENDDAESTVRKTLIDLDNDCLEHLFQFLEFRDIINVAEANAHLKVAANAVFVRKLKKRLVIVESDPNLDARHPDVGNYEDAISIYTMPLAVKTIRNFGSSIAGMQLKIKTSDFLREKFFLHVNEYCHKALNTLQVFGDHSSIYGRVDHPFGNVERFYSCSGAIGPGCEQINRVFPRLSQLKFIDNDILDLKPIAQTYPNLEAFAFNYDWEFPNNFIASNLITIMTLNPQIESFELLSYHDPRIWQLIDAQLRNLKSIRASYFPDHAHSVNGAPIRFNHTEVFEVISRHGLSAVNPLNMFSFKNLKTLTVKCWDEESDMWLDFVIAHPTIERLEIRIVAPTAWMMYADTFKKIRGKMEKVSQRTKFISLQMNGFLFNEHRFKGDTLKLLKFIAAQKWFKTVCVIFKFSSIYDSFDELAGMEGFMENVSKMCGKTPKLRSLTKMYKINKHILSDKVYIDFVRCEQLK